MSMPFPKYNKKVMVSQGNCAMPLKISIHEEYMQAVAMLVSLTGIE